MPLSLLSSSLDAAHERDHIPGVLRCRFGIDPRERPRGIGALLNRYRAEHALKRDPLDQLVGGYAFG